MKSQENSIVSGISVEIPQFSLGHWQESCADKGAEISLTRNFGVDSSVAGLTFLAQSITKNLHIFGQGKRSRLQG